MAGVAIPLCPVHALIWRVLHLRSAGAAATLPINTFRPSDGPWQFVLAADVTAVIRQAAIFLPNLDTKDFSARCTRAGGAMALLLLCGGNDSIRLIGRRAVAL